MPLTRADIRLIQLAHAKYPDVKKSLLGGLIIHESQDREVTNPTSGAFGRTQFLPSTARAYGVKHGDAKSQIFGAAHYLHDLGIGKNELNALNHYSGGGGTSYQNAVHQLASQVRGSLKGGPSTGAVGSQESAGGAGSTQTTFTPGETVTPGDSAFAAILTQQLQQPQQHPVSGGGLPDPAFSARNSLHVAGQQPASSGGGPAPKLSLSDQLAAVRAIQGGTVPKPPSTSTTTTVDGGTAASGAVSGSTRPLLERAVAVSNANPRYQWGGGHGAKPAKLGTPVDCSGYVSQILGVSPRTSGQFMSFGDKGPGKRVTVWANSGHVLLQIGSRWFATSNELLHGKQGGAGERSTPSAAYLSRFTPRHPKGQ